MHFLHNSFSNLRFTLIEGYLFEEGCTIIDGEGADLCDALAPECDCEDFRFKASTFTSGTWRLTHIGLVLIAAVIAICL